MKVALNSHVPFFEILTVKVSTCSSKVNLKQTNVISWLPNGKSMLCYALYFTLLCCPWIGYSTSLPAGNLKSMEYSCLWWSHITSVANVKSTNLGAKFKEEQNLFLSLCIDDITTVCLKFIFGDKGTYFNCQYLENEAYKIDENFTRMLRLNNTMIIVGLDYPFNGTDLEKLFSRGDVVDQCTYTNDMYSAEGARCMTHAQNVKLNWARTPS